MDREDKRLEKLGRLTESFWNRLTLQQKGDILAVAQYFYDNEAGVYVMEHLDHQPSADLLSDFFEQAMELTGD